MSYILYVIYIIGMCIGLLTVMADFLGAIGSGTGMHNIIYICCYIKCCVL